MKWFSGVNTHNKELYINYINMYTVAVITAKKTNPSIEPYLILDGEIDDLIQYLIDMGVTVIKHTVTFYNELKEHYKDNTISLGAFLRIDIPKICNDLNIEDDYVLYTDNDVMFINDVSSLYELKPKYFMCAGEFDPKFTPMGMNSGVMWINWKNMNEDYDNFVFFIKNNLHKFETYDQDAIRQFFKDKMEEFDYRFNYKPYWGNDDDIKILHFHGPKPTFNNKQLKDFPYPKLITPFFNEMSNKFNQILENI
jgi:lipopolysaccharide biosynthesis glycosyltransferase